MAEAELPKEQLVWVAFIEEGQAIQDVSQWIQFARSSTASDLMGHMVTWMHVPPLALLSTRMKVLDRDFPLGVTLAEHGVDGKMVMVEIVIHDAWQSGDSEPFYGADILQHPSIVNPAPIRKARLVGASKFLQAVCEHDWDTAWRELEARPDAYKDRSKSNHSALAYTVSANNPKMGRRLLELGAQPHTVNVSPPAGKEDQKNADGAESDAAASGPPLSESGADALMFLACRLPENSDTWVELLMEFKADPLTSCGATTQLEVLAGCSNPEALRAVLDRVEDSLDPAIKSNLMPLACAAGSLPNLNLLLERGYDPNTLSQQFGSALRVAMVQPFGGPCALRLLDAKADPKLAAFIPEGSPDPASQLPYVAWCAERQPEVLKRLLELQADPNSCGDDGKVSPLLQACLAKNFDSVRILVEAKADVNFSADPDGVPLDASLFTNSPQIVKYLLEHGADPHRTFISPHDNSPILPITRAVVHNSPELLQLLLDAGVSPDTRINGNPIVSLALRSNFHESARLLIQAKADISNLPVGLKANNRRVLKAFSTSFHPPRRHESNTSLLEPLIFSASNPEGVKLAVESGCDVNMEHENLTPLAMAVFQEDLPRVQALLDHGADPNTVFKPSGNSLLAHACTKDPKIVHMLLLAGADVNLNTGIPPLHILMMHGRFEEFWGFVAIGADTRCKNPDGQTLVEAFASLGAEPELVARLEEGLRDAEAANAQRRQNGSMLTPDQMVAIHVAKQAEAAEANQGAQEGQEGAQEQPRGELEPKPV